MINTELFALLSRFADAVDNGHTNPLKAFVEIKRLQQMIDDIKDSIQDQAIAERMKYGKEEVVIDGFKVEQVPGRKNWKYDHSDAWQAVNERKKTLESLMQKAYAGTSIVDGETGEEIEPAALTFSKETLRLTEVK
jgi:hypothetical protein